MEFKITKEQIDELATTGNHYTERYLQSIFPEAFKTELELNKWYNRENCPNMMVFITKHISGNRYSGYGISEGEWFSNYRVVSSLYPCFPAATEEIEAALIAEAKKKGYKKGVKCNNSNLNNRELQNNIISTDEFYYDAVSNELRARRVEHDVYYPIFKNGIWAEILPTEKTVIPREKALKILAKKLKVSPENIEIK